MILSLSFLQTGLSLLCFLFVAAKNPWSDGQVRGKARRLRKFISKFFTYTPLFRLVNSKMGIKVREITGDQGSIFMADGKGRVAVGVRK